jgi:phosphotriesterase-related protein
MSRFTGKAMTVLGPVDPEDLGTTMMHEHLFIDPGPTPVYFRFPDDPSERKIAMQPLTLDNLGWARFNYLNHWDLNVIDDEDIVTEEVMRYKYAGGRTLVDVSPISLGRTHLGVKRVAMRTGVNIVRGSGYYVGASHPPQMENWSVDEVKENIVSEHRDGIGGSDIKSGIIGEIGVTYPWGKTEKKVLQASARAMAETGLSLEVHPGRSPRQPDQIIDVLEGEKADLSRVAICHIDRTIEDITALKAVMDRGCTIGFDAFGLAWYPWAMEIPYPSDSMRIFQIKKLVDAGYAGKIYVSHDIDDKHTQYHFGGWGYAHILNNVLPLMKHHGITDEQINTILVENPKKLLTIV